MDISKKKRLLLAGLAIATGAILTVIVLTQQLSWQEFCSGRLRINWGIAGNTSKCIESTSITGIVWDEISTITRLATGSDNWPITWGDDGELYTAYGDGWGFIPKVPDKLSLGFAKVSGDPHAHTGVNIPSDGDQIGNGASGKKASGLLMVDGRLWMWVRNANQNGRQCQLAYSDNHAANWTWIDWKFEEFGFCTFVNFGQDYAGARDDYVYMVSHDNLHAYSAADSMILTRVPKEQVGNKSVYEFFVEDGPIWTSDIAQRGAVITWPGSLARSGISYSAGLERYIWWTQNASSGIDTRFSGGFRLWEAPEPWGPWTVFYETSEWDVGPGERAEFPPGWMSADGHRVYLLFSGNDAFSVRGATLETQ